MLTINTNAAEITGIKVTAEGSGDDEKVGTVLSIKVSTQNRDILKHLSGSENACTLFSHGNGDYPIYPMFKKFESKFVSDGVIAHFPHVKVYAHGCKLSDFKIACEEGGVILLNFKLTVFEFDNGAQDEHTMKQLIKKPIQMSLSVDLDENEEDSPHLQIA